MLSNPALPAHASPPARKGVSSVGLSNAHSERRRPARYSSSASLALLGCLLLPVAHAEEVRVQRSLQAKLNGAGPLEVIVELSPPQGARPRSDETWKKAVASQRERVLTCAGMSSHQLLTTYSFHPTLHLRASPTALRRLAQCPEVVAMGEVRTERLFLTESLPLISQPELLDETGVDGEGTTVAIIDTGAFTDNPELGACYGQDNCRLVAGYDFADNDTDPTDCNGHGTNVAAIAAGSAGVAPGARIAALKVFSSNGCTLATSDNVLEALDWVIDHADDYHIASVNLSLGGDRYSSECDAQDVVGYRSAIDTLTQIGVLVVAAAGNDGWADAVAYPACLSNVLAVANSYDSNFKGTLCWGANTCVAATCIDKDPKVDSIVCVSNGGSLIDLAAPGAMIQAGGYEMAGTSQASPHVAGAAALLRQAAPEASTAVLWEALLASPDEVVDNRSSSVYPRLNVLAAIEALPDLDGDGYGPLQDCNDDAAAAHPGGSEVCDGLDNDCNGIVDEGFDLDSDGFAPCVGDCDDSDASIYPGADDPDDRIDQNCDGEGGGCSCQHGASGDVSGMALGILVLSIARHRPMRRRPAGSRRRR